MGSEATIRSLPPCLRARWLLPCEICLTKADWRRWLWPRRRSCCLAPIHSGDATSRIEAYTERLADTVRKGVEKLTVAAVPLRPSLRAPLVDHLRHWLAHEPPGKLQIVLEDHGDFGALLLLFWIVEGGPTLYASNFYADRRGALEGLNRDVLEPAGLAPVLYTKKLNWRLPKPARDKKQRHQREAPLP